MTTQSDPGVSLVEKLEAFTSSLSPEEQEIFGEILLNAVQAGSTDDVRGHIISSARSSLLGGALTLAQTQNKTLTRLQLGGHPASPVLAVVGAAAGRFR